MEFTQRDVLPLISQGYLRSIFLNEQIDRQLIVDSNAYRSSM